MLHFIVYKAVIFVTNRTLKKPIENDMPTYFPCFQMCYTYISASYLSRNGMQN